MKTEIIPASEIQTTLEILRSGGIVAFPTDTVYGLGALAFNNDAIESIYSAKDRPIEKAIPILIGDLNTEQSGASRCGGRPVSHYLPMYPYCKYAKIFFRLINYFYGIPIL